MTGDIIQQIAVSQIIINSSHRLTDDPNNPGYARVDTSERALISQLPDRTYPITIDNTIVRKGGASLKFTARYAEYYTNSDGFITNRQSLGNKFWRYAESRHVWASVSYYFPESNEGDVSDELLTNWRMSGTWSLGIYRIKNEMRVNWSPNSSGSLNGAINVIVVPEIQRGQWYDIVWEVVISDDINVGRIRFWINGKLARAHNPTTKQKTIIPTTSPTAGFNDIFIAPTNTIGVFAQTVDDGVPCSVLDFTGKTHRDLSLSNGTELEYRTGLYKYGFQQYYDQNNPPGEVLPPTDPYIVYMDNIKVALPTNTDYNLFKQLDADGADPIEGIEIPVSGPFSLTLSSSNESLGTVSRTGSNPVTSGGTVTLTATPIGAGVFQGWYRNSVSLANRISTSNPYVLTMNQDENIIGSFSLPVPPNQRKGFAKKRNQPIV